jgi:pSer/pThr/pTyr-binding forkhead associated (FHA) protein
VVVPDGGTLDVIAGPAAGQRFETGPALVIGRSEEGPGALGGDPELSRRHAALSRLRDGRLLVEDLGSTNGTWVNGTRIPAPTLLTAGDEVALGGSVLRVRSSEEARHAGAADQTGAAGLTAAPRVKRPGLRVVAGWAVGAQIPVGDGPLVLGTAAAGRDEFGGDPAIAGEHALVTPLDDGRVLLEDLGSGLGTTVAGSPIPAPTLLSRGDRFGIGGQVLEVIGMAGLVGPASESAVAGGVRKVPESLFDRIAERAPVTGAEVLRTYALALGWAAAANLLIRTFAVEVADVPSDLNSIQAVPLLFATLLPVTFNAFGFARLFRRPDHTSVRRYLIPTVVVPIVFLIINLVRMNYSGFPETVATVAVTIVPVLICAPLMLRLRERVAAERLRQVRP